MFDAKEPLDAIIPDDVVEMPEARTKRLRPEQGEEGDSKKKVRVGSILTAERMVSFTNPGIG